MNVRVIFTGRSYHKAAGLPDQFELPEGAHLRDALAAINAQLPDGVSLPPTCLIAIAGQHIGNVANFEDRALREGQEITLVTPVAGG